MSIRGYSPPAKNIVVMRCFDANELLLIRHWVRTAGSLPRGAVRYHRRMIHSCQLRLAMILGRTMRDQKKPISEYGILALRELVAPDTWLVVEERREELQNRIRTFFPSLPGTSTRVLYEYPA